MDKRARLDAYLDDRGLESVWFARPNGFAWLTGGDNVVDREADVGVAAAGYDGERVRVVTSNVEASRLRAEELSADVEVEAFPWARDLSRGGRRRPESDARGGGFRRSGFRDGGRLAASNAAHD